MDIVKYYNSKVADSLSINSGAGAVYRILKNFGAPACYYWALALNVIGKDGVWEQSEWAIFDKMLTFLYNEGYVVDKNLTASINNAILEYAVEYVDWRDRNVLGYDSERMLYNEYEKFEEAVYDAKEAMNDLFKNPFEAAKMLDDVGNKICSIAKSVKKRFELEE